MRGGAAVVVVLAVVAVLMVPLAVVLDSSAPLFFAWIPQLSILVFLSRRDRSAASPPQADTVSGGFDDAG